MLEFTEKRNFDGKSFNVNINERVEFTLTEYGKSIVDADNESLSKEPFYFPTKYDENLKCRMPLYNFMNIFGKNIVIGNKLIIEENTLRFVMK